MGYLRSVSETIVKRAMAEPRFRAGLFAEVIELLVQNDIQTAKHVICEYILASIGFETIAKQIGKKPGSIKRMLSNKGNPRLKDMAALLSAIREQEGITLHVKTTSQ